MMLFLLVPALTSRYDAKSLGGVGMIIVLINEVVKKYILGLSKQASIVASGQSTSKVRGKTPLDIGDALAGFISHL